MKVSSILARIITLKNALSSKSSLKFSPKRFMDVLGSHHSKTNIALTDVRIKTHKLKIQFRFYLSFSLAKKDNIRNQNFPKLLELIKMAKGCPYLY